MKRAIAQGDLVHIRRGLYCLSEKYRRSPLNLFALAQKIYGPSYISLESALSHHGWIPESVHAVTSVTSKRSVEFQNPLGLFIYQRVVSHPLLTGVERIEGESGSYLIARPWKAIADYVYLHKLDWKGFEPLKESLRIEEEHLLKIDDKELEEIVASYKNHRVKRFLDAIRRKIQ